MATTMLLKSGIPPLQSQEQAPTGPSAAPGVLQKKTDVGGITGLHLPPPQLKQQQQQRRGQGGVYARREKMHNLPIQTLHQRRAALPPNDPQCQQQLLLLQKHLPAFFPTSTEGEFSEDGKKLQRVLAFQQFSALTGGAEAASGKRGEPPDWAKAAVAMAAFGLPPEAKDVMRDDNRWKRAFARQTSVPETSPIPADSQFLLFMALAAEASRRYEEADGYMLRMLVANAIRKVETPAKQRQCMQKIISRRLRHQRNLWKQTVALEHALQTRQSAVEDRLISKARLEKTSQLEEVLAYKQRLKMDIVRHCYGVIWTTTHLLKPFAVTIPGRVFVHKTIAAAYRQATQYTEAIAQFQCLELAKTNYELAVDLARTHVGDFEACDMSRLEVFISWVNFLFYNLKEHKAALLEARRTLQEALHALPGVKDGKEFNEIVEALQTLMRSIRRWMEETQKDAVFDWWMG